MIKAKRSEIMEFDVYGSGSPPRFDYVLLKVETARRLSEFPKGVKVRWGDGRFQGSHEFDELQKAKPLHYCLYVPLSSPTELVVVPTHLDAKWDDEKIVNEEVGETVKALVAALKKAIPTKAEIADRNYERNYKDWVQGKGGSLEERRVKEMLARRQAEEEKAKAPVHTREDHGANLNRSGNAKTVVDAVKVNMHLVRASLGHLRRLGVMASDKESMLKALSIAERDLAEIRKSVERMP